MITPGANQNYVVDKTLGSATLTVNSWQCSGGCALTYELQQMKSDGSGEFELVDPAFISNSLSSDPSTIKIESIATNPTPAILSSTLNLYISGRAEIIN